MNEAVVKFLYPTNGLASKEDTNVPLAQSDPRPRLPPLGVLWHLSQVMQHPTTEGDLGLAECPLKRVPRQLPFRPKLKRILSLINKAHGVKTPINGR